MIENLICYRTVPSRVSGTLCGSSYGRFCDYFIVDSMCDSLSKVFFIIVDASVTTCIAHLTAHNHRNCIIFSPHRSCVDYACGCLVVFFYPHQFCYDVLNERWPPMAYSLSATFSGNSRSEHCLNLSNCADLTA